MVHGKPPPPPPPHHLESQARETYICDIMIAMRHLSFTSTFFFFFFLLLNSVYTVLPLSQGLDRVKWGTIHMKTVKYLHTKLCLSVYTEY